MTDGIKNHISSNGKGAAHHELPEFEVQRQVLLQDHVNQLSGYQENTNSKFTEKVSSACSNFDLKRCLKQTIPILEWLPNYSVKNNLIGDITSGITVAVMHIPQGMAYGLLAGVSPSVGLYMAFFPTLVYFVFGTSRHVSMGTFAVISLMTSKIVGLHANPILKISENSTIIDSAGDFMTTTYTPIQVVTATSFIVGIFHLVMFVLRLGTTASLLSEPLTNGFTTAAAVHVLVSQLKDILGVNIGRHKGVFKVVYTIQDIFLSLNNANKAAILTSTVVILFMVTMNEFVKPWAAKKCRFPIPAELLAVVGGTVLSYVMQLGTIHNVHLVGEIPVGIPTPELPSMKLVGAVAIDSIGIAVVSYSIVMSMGLLFAKKQKYEIRANQELLALGFSNMVGSMFSCVPISCSLARSVIQEQTGGKTQVASVISAGLILVVLLWIGPYFESLPRCVLGGVIIVALKGMFVQAGQLRKFFKEGKVEGIVWLVTFVSVVIIDIDVGLLLGILLSIAALYLKGWKSYSCLLGLIENTGVYVDLEHHKNAVEILKTKIFRYSGSINFASRADFKKSLYKKINVTLQAIRAAALNTPNDENGFDGIRTVIIDISCIAHIDAAGCKTMSEMQRDMKTLGVTFLLACPSDRAYKALAHGVALGEGPFAIFPTIHDAVLFCQGKEKETV